MRPAFTMVELLVVVAIILVLAGLLLAALPMVLLAGRSARTVHRIEEIQAGFTRLGKETGGPALVVQQRAGLGGVTLFHHPNRSQVPVPQTGSWQDGAEPHRFTFPWGQADRLGLAEPQAALIGSERWSTATLADLDARRSGELMHVAGIVANAASPTAYRDDRGPDRAWNDAWGRPLIVAYGVFQPTTGEAVRTALRQYGHNRAVYIGIGAWGPATFPTDPVWEDRLSTAWQGITSVAQAGGAWDGQAWNDPPWQGVIRRGGGVERRWLSVPLELR